MQKEIGIMQGRLSRDPGGRFQFFPIRWQEEFSLAREKGFSYIEWLADWRDSAVNPLLSGANVDSVRESALAHGLRIRSVCADYFMKYRFLGDEAETAKQTLREIIAHSSRITETPIIVIPFLESNAIKNETDKEEIVRAITSVLVATEKSGALLAFETEMPVDELLDFLSRFKNPRVGVCYDVGNCTSYGFTCPQDLKVLSSRVFDVHIKDRKVGQTASMPLGEGDADFSGCFSALRDIGYEGPIILQAWRGETTYLDDAKRQGTFVKRLFTDIAR